MLNQEGVLWIALAIVQIIPQILIEYVTLKQHEKILLIKLLR